jgi:dihydroxyacetone kinase-like predicted kinase
MTEEKVKAVGASIEESYPEHEIELHNGGQPHYHIIMSLE